MKNKILNLLVIFIAIAGFAALTLIAAEKSPYEPNLPNGPNVPDANISAPNVPGPNMPEPNVPFEPNKMPAPSKTE
jgi:hypothetical protein